MTTPNVYTGANDVLVCVFLRFIKFLSPGEKPFKCTECEYAASKLVNLQRHMRCHAKESLPFRTKQEVVIEPDNEDTAPEDLDPGSIFSYLWCVLL